jgi:adenine deaminase
MVTINAATYFGLKEIGVLGPGKFADMVVLSDLTKMKAEKVYIGGRLIAEGGAMTAHIPRYTYPDNVKHSFNCRRVNSDQLKAKVQRKQVKVRTIGLIPDQNLTDAFEFTLSVEENIPQPDLNQDVLPIAVVERYGKNGNAGKAFVKGFGLKRGAFAESVSHDSHNIIVVGTDYDDMSLAVNRVIEMSGGVAVVQNRQVLSDLRLPIGGLMTDEMDGFEVTRKIEELHRIVRSELGCTLHAPLMHLSFLSLTTSPKWKITDQGLIDVENFRKLSPICSDG